ncbi:MAG: NADH-quinone oxidoreductase subunit NuoE [bacterium]|nr:NADH-quinone oxidoreductase subunit NuoE [bacterium]
MDAPFILDDEEVSQLLSRYPDKRAALLPLLQQIQARAGYVSEEAAQYAAGLLGVHRSLVHEVVSFYTMLHDRPVGRYLIYLCDSICCALVGSEPLLDHVKKVLGIEVGETTADGLFTLETVECLAQCEKAPAVMINEEVFGPVTPEEMERILKEKRG